VIGLGFLKILGEGSVSSSFATSISPLEERRQGAVDYTGRRARDADSELSLREALLDNKKIGRDSGECLGFMQATKILIKRILY
jgi:hypothetical protein